MNKSVGVILGTLAVAFFIGGCSNSPPKTEEGRDALKDKAEATIKEMKAKDTDLNNKFLRNAYGYAVFPDVSAGGAIVGGASGRGIVYQGSKVVGYAELNQASVGATLGGKSYSELIVFKDGAAFSQLQSGTLDLGAQASAVVLKAGASAEATFADGRAIFLLPQGGLMIDLSVKGQTLKYQPANMVESKNNMNNNNMNNNNMNNDNMHDNMNNNK